MAHEMASGPDADEISDWITSTYPETVVGEAMDARFMTDWRDRGNRDGAAGLTR